MIKEEEMMEPPLHQEMVEGRRKDADEFEYLEYRADTAGGVAGGGT